MGLRWGGALLCAAVLPGCRTPEPATVPAPESAPAAAPEAAAPAVEAPPPVGPVPVLALVPGARHRFRHEMAFRMQFPEETAFGAIVMNATADAVHTVLDPGRTGEGRVATLLGRVRGSMSMETMGFRMEFDSANEAQVRASRGSGPLAAMRVILGSVGVPRVWVLKTHSMPAAEAAAGAEDPESAAKDHSPDVFEVMVPLAWIDILPRRGIRAGDEGPLAGAFSGMGQFGGALKSARWRVAAWDSDSGVAEFVVHATGGSPGSPGSESSPEEFEAEITDRFDVGRGVLLSRRMRITGRAPAAGFLETGVDAATVALEADFRIERLPDPAPAAPAR